MATIYDIAKKLNLSSATVSRVLNGVDHPVSEKTRNRILEAAREMDYRPNIIAKSLTNGKTQTIAILLPSITNDFYTQLVDIIENDIGRAGYSVFLCNTHREVERETDFVRTLLQRRVDGVVFCPTRRKTEDNARNLQNIGQLVKNRIPVVAIGSHFDGISRVYVDTFEGARMATEYLISLGHRAVGFIDGLSAGTSRRRYRGYAAALKSHGIPLRRDLVRRGGLTYESGFACARELLERARPTAILAVNNAMAVGALNAARSRGISVPEGLSIVGFDDSPVSKLVSPQLTVVRQPLEAIGEQMKRMLTALLKGPAEPEAVRLMPELVRRESCAPPREGVFSEEADH